MAIDPEAVWQNDNRDYFGYDEQPPDYDDYVVPPSEGEVAPTRALPSYDDPEWDTRELAPADPAGMCERHRRALTKQEYEQKVCFWCDPAAYHRFLTRRLALNPVPELKNPKKKTTGERRQEKAHAEASAAVKNWPKILASIKEINEKADWQEAHPIGLGGS